MLTAVLWLAVTINVACRERVIRCDVLECNKFPGGVQLIAWEDRPGVDYRWPLDWCMSPRGHVSGGVWWDENGTAVKPSEWRNTETSFDPERRAYDWWMKHGQRDRQGGIWRK